MRCIKYELDYLLTYELQARRNRRFFHRVLRVLHAFDQMGMSVEEIAEQMVALIGDYEHLMSWFRAIMPCVLTYNDEFTV